MLEMVTSPEYKAKTRASKVTAQEAAALPIAMRNLKKIYDAAILVALGTDSGRDSDPRTRVCRTHGARADGTGWTHAATGD